MVTPKKTPKMIDQQNEYPVLLHLALELNIAAADGARVRFKFPARIRFREAADAAARPKMIMASSRRRHDVIADCRGREDACAAAA